MSDPLLRLESVTVTAHPRDSEPITLIHEVDLDVGAGEVVCLVGESGSGKSVTARTILGLTELRESMEVTGRIIFDGRDIRGLSAADARQLRGREIAMVFQEPLSSLDPVFTIEHQLRESLRRTARCSRRAARARSVELLRGVGIVDAERVLQSYPHRLSGGMCQRIMIAMALASSPKLLVADEPTTALDVTIQAQILELMDALRRDSDMGILLITHDMGVAADIADRVVVMYAGRVVEDASLEIFSTPRHPYTAGLLGCIPVMTGPRPDRLPAISGAVPHPSALPGGCSFHPRCERVTARCEAHVPVEVVVGSSRVACWHPIAEEPPP